MFYPAIRPDNVNEKDNDMKTSGDICALVRQMISFICLEPDKVRVWDEPTGRSTIIKAQCSKSDMPRVVGSGAVHVRAMEKLVELMGRRSGLSMRFRLIEPEPGNSSRHGGFKPNPNWNSEPFMTLLGGVGDAIFRYGCKVENFDDDAIGETTMDLVASTKEQAELVEFVSGPVKLLWNAMGKANGRLIFANVSQDDVPAV